MRLFTVALLSLFLFGCSSVPYDSPMTVTVIERPKEVFIPIVQECPKPPAIERPDLPISEIKDVDTAGEVMEKYVRTFKVLNEYIKKLEEIIESYRK